MTSLFISAQKYAQIKAALLAAYPTLAEDEQAFADTLEGLGANDLTDLIQHVVLSIEEDEHLAAAIGERIAQLAQRASRLEARADKKRAAILAALQEAGINRPLQLPSVTLSLANDPPSVRIIEAALIPKGYFVEQVTPEPKLDKRGLVRDLREGKDIPGVTLNNPGKHIVWRTT